MSTPQHPRNRTGDFQCANVGTGGHGPSRGFRADLEVLREYFRDNDPDFSSRSRRSQGSRRERRRLRLKQPLSPAQQRLMDKAAEHGLTESALMDRMQARKLVPVKHVWLHELTPAECKAAFAKRPWE